MGKSNTLTHEEIWDDSSLVRSWDDAVEEYQLYHSIHAKGENVEDVLREAEETGLTEEGHVIDDAEETDVQDVAMECEPEDTNVSAPDATPLVPKPVSEEASQQSAPEGAIPAAGGPKLPAAAMPMPEAVLAQVQDESLKRLMMAWYYAGYYTGLHEGQQQANQTKS
ncbi:Survival motor neuron [Penicillium sp. IBT 16267x]|nr:Survival motor neuron [Penicillium sp. IBT 16267x]